ncbi:MAG: hypothetical protein JRN21_04440 [Nitrososphaerota archaeon]|nr:hypothetical protein [Nitrososphaerota archaeon]
MRSWTTPFDREKRFIDSLNMPLIQRALWPLLAVYVLLNFSDVLTTLIAWATGPGFIEYNHLGSLMFNLGPIGFMLAYALKFVTIAPLLFMAWYRAKPGTDDFQVKLLKFAAFVVLVAVDIGLGAIVVGNNLPVLLRHVGA